jgi:hypothetical protein
MRVFISHATEDKAAFVRPLAEALRQHYKVWYDEYELTIGDSLLKKINEGLASSDYGVVVLSPAFFQKKWPQAELDGLFALEGTSRKMILPVWKDVSEPEVKKFSPILAGRLGAIASDGVQKVVDEIRRAIEVSDRTRQISAASSIVQKALSLDQTFAERNLNERLSRCEDGVTIVKQGFDSIYISFQSAVDQIQKVSQVLRFGIDKPSHPFGQQIVVRINSGFALNILLTGLGGNWTYETKLAAVITKRNLQRLGFDNKPDSVSEMTFEPAFKLQNQLVWLNQSGRKSYSSEDLSSFLLETLIDEAKKRN